MCEIFVTTLIAGWLYSGCLAQAQNPQCPTRPVGDSTNACASTAFVSTALASGIPLAQNLFLVGNASNLGAGRTIVGSDLPNPTTTTLGGVNSLPAAANQVICSISNAGAPGACTVTGTGNVVLATSPSITTANFVTSYSFAGIKLYDEAGALRTFYHPDGAAPFFQWNATAAFIKSDTTTFSNSSGAVTYADFEAAGLRIFGSTSGSILFSVPAVSGSNQITFPAGTTDFSATGGTSQVVKQTSAGGAFTVARLACADLSDAGSGCAGSSAIVVGTTVITGGTDTRILFNNAGVVGEYPIGTNVATALAVNVGSAGAFVTFNGALGTPSSGTVTNLTGTASININGTVGATTPTTGAFTTVTASTAAGVTLSSNSTPTVTFGTSGNVVAKLLAIGNSGVVDLFNGGGRIARFNGAASAVNYLDVTAAASGGGVQFKAVGGDTDVAINFSSFGAGAVSFYTSNASILQVQFTHTASATRWLTLTGSNGGNPTIGTSAGNVAITPALVGGSYLQTGVVAVGSLPTCDAGTKGARHFVNDSNAVSYTAGIGAVVAAGGATNVPVVCDGTNWRIG